MADATPSAPRGAGPWPSAAPPPSSSFSSTSSSAYSYASPNSSIQRITPAPPPPFAAAAVAGYRARSTSVSGRSVPRPPLAPAAPNPSAPSIAANFLSSSSQPHQLQQPQSQSQQQLRQQLAVRSFERGDDAAGLSIGGGDAPYSAPRAVLRPSKSMSDTRAKPVAPPRRDSQKRKLAPRSSTPSSNGEARPVDEPPPSFKVLMSTPGVHWGYIDKLDPQPAAGSQHSNSGADGDSPTTTATPSLLTPTSTRSSSSSSLSAASSTAVSYTRHAAILTPAGSLHLFSIPIDGPGATPVTTVRLASGRFRVRFDEPDGADPATFAVRITARRGAAADGISGAVGANGIEFRVVGVASEEREEEDEAAAERIVRQAWEGWKVGLVSVLVEGAAAAAASVAAESTEAARDRDSRTPAPAEEGEYHQPLRAPPRKQSIGSLAMYSASKAARRSVEAEVSPPTVIPTPIPTPSPSTTAKAEATTATTPTTPAPAIQSPAPRPAQPTAAAYLAALSPPPSPHLPSNTNATDTSNSRDPRRPRTRSADAVTSPPSTPGDNAASPPPLSAATSSSFPLSPSPMSPMSPIPRSTPTPTPKHMAAGEGWAALSKNASYAEQFRKYQEDMERRRAAAVQQQQQQQQQIQQQTGMFGGSGSAQQQQQPQPYGQPGTGGPRIVQGYGSMRVPAGTFSLGAEVDPAERGRREAAAEASRRGRSATKKLYGMTWR
ncbi:hypothetical protein DFJ73DRAFT_799702 [Zopfochytrium polystomum]|nr:hypothetical protein DFJ73DRAFT_799702 [Zopfochytrium polystomum]